MIAGNPLAGLPPGIAVQIQAELSRYPYVGRVILFGSRAIGTHRHSSDIDLCLEAPDMKFTDYLLLASSLQERVLPYSLDLVLKHHIDNPDLLDHIKRVGVLVHEQ